MELPRFDSKRMVTLPSGNFSSTSVAHRQRPERTTNEPVNSGQPPRSAASCPRAGPAIAAPSVPIMTVETARPASSAGTNSIAAKRYCCTNAMLLPMKNAAAHKVTKFAVAMLQAMTSAAGAATRALPMKAGLRPIRCMSRAAGKELDAMPSTDKDRGRVAR